MAPGGDGHKKQGNAQAKEGADHKGMVWCACNFGLNPMQFEAGWLNVNCTGVLRFVKGNGDRARRCYAIGDVEVVLARQAIKS